MGINYIAVVQARMGSSRLPGKVLKKIEDKTIIEILLHRLSLSNNIDKIILATSTNSENDILFNKVNELGFEVFRGSENDVLSRYYNCVKEYRPKAIVRITGDCPLIDPMIIDDMIQCFENN